MASLSSAMPSTFVYFEALQLSIAAIAARLILSGVSKSGSPAPNPMTLRPASLSARALSVTAMVADGFMRLSWSATKAIENHRLVPRFCDAHVVMRESESGKARFGHEIRPFQSVPRINPDSASPSPPCAPAGAKARAFRRPDPYPLVQTRLGARSLTKRQNGLRIITPRQSSRLRRLAYR